MSSSEKHTSRNKHLMDQSADLFSRTTIPFDRTRSDAWRFLSEKIQSGKPVVKDARAITLNRRGFALAASLAMLLVIGSFLRLYKVEVVNIAGENVSAELPDGSIAQLNGNTTIHYHPVWWYVSRKVDQEGEAFYQVKHGKTFSVVTAMGSAEVLGTTFTVLSRGQKFSVTCHTGKVGVQEHGSGNYVTLERNEKARLSDGVLKLSRIPVDAHTPAWNRKIFVFTSTPISTVFEEIESQFNIEIDTPEDLNLIYTGSFKRDQSADKIISLICRPFNLDYEKRSDSEYRIYSSEKE